MHWPYKQHKTSRNQRVLPYHNELKDAGACFGQSGEYERPMWYSLNNSEPSYKYSFNYQNWYPSLEHECKNTIENVGLFELSPFSKYEIKGEKSFEELQKLCTANIRNEIGKCTYTQMLNQDAGIETDLTVVCIDKNHFRIISSAQVRTHDKAHILKYLSKDIEFKDITDELVCLGVFGPRSRSLLSKIFKEDFSNDKFKFGTGKNIKLDSINLWVQRLSYVGELGFELYIDNENALKIYKKIVDKGKEFHLSHCGAHAMDVMRMESGFLHWGHDISPEDNQYQAGLNFAIDYKKNFNFIGKEKLLKIRDKKLDRRLIMLVLKDSSPGNPLLLHEEPIYLENNIIGKTTSGNYSFNFKKNLSFGYIKSNLTNDDLNKRDMYIEIEKKKYSVKILAKPLKQNEFKHI
jgi:4-methylaminobutanoate oxidase (formaldehyde-forming)